MSSASSPPSIRIYESSQYSLPHHLRQPNSTTSMAMTIPGTCQGAAPPPLPPPRYINDLQTGRDPAWQWGHINSSRDTALTGNHHPSLRSGSSLRGTSGWDDSRDHESSKDFTRPNRHDPSTSLDDVSSENSVEHNSDDEPRRKTRSSLGNHRFTSERHLGQLLQNSSQAYDKQLLSKIGGPKSAKRPSIASPSCGGPDSLVEAQNAPHKLTTQLKPLSVPDRPHSTLDSPALKWPASGALSPAHSDICSPAVEFSPADPHRARFNSISTVGPLDEIPTHSRSNYKPTVFSDLDFVMEENGMRELKLGDRSPGEPEEYQQGSKNSLKRCASSPHVDATREDRHPVSGHNDLYHRRSSQMLVSRNNSSSRIQGNSLSSTTSGLLTGSMSYSYGLPAAASSMTSYSSEQRLSPSALSPLGGSDPGSASPHTATMALNPSPCGSLSRSSHLRASSENDQPRVRKLPSESLSSPRQIAMGSRIPGAFLCECCPKKPKKFDNEEDLRNHELEKQYICQYCPNRFKNKNEAERHQNSLHLRRYSWSCQRLAAVEATFHPSPTRPVAADVCGYCGDEFPNPADWEARSEHLNLVHKFGECNQTKKFFRADHFRQHLKHSHAGTSGKWTNVLENTCMRDEPTLNKAMITEIQEE